MVAATGTAWSADMPKSINEPPHGPGTELKSTLEPVRNRVVPGWEVSGQMGGGQGFGLSARAGYTVDRGIYLGGNFTHFWGSSVPTVNGDQRTSQNMLGGDIGYKMFFFDRSFEVRPFVFMGADFRHENHPETLTVSSETSFSLHASGLAAYHFGPAFVSGEVRLMITPTPVHVAGFGGIGLAL
jgi:hypothetical protein